MDNINEIKYLKGVFDMKVPHTKPFKTGYNSIAEMNGKYEEMQMDFGILMLKPGFVYENNDNKERAFLLIQGKIQYEWDGETVVANRSSWKNDSPWCLSVSPGVKVKIIGVSDTAQVAVHATDNDLSFPSKLYRPEEIPSTLRGKDVNDDTACRIFRTIIDATINPDSNFVLGEDVHLPGRWSGYPNHYHPQPEIYFFKFYPENGFGMQRLGNDAIYLEENDTSTIYPNEVHPCVVAPGYHMYYIWVIREDRNDRYRPWFEMQHTWVPGIWVSDEEKYMLP